MFGIKAAVLPNGDKTPPPKAFLRKKKAATYIKPLLVLTFVSAFALFSAKSFGGSKPFTFSGAVQDSTKKSQLELIIPSGYFHMVPLVETAINEVNLLLPEEHKTRKVKVVKLNADDERDPHFAVYNPFPVPNIFAGSGLLEDSILVRLSFFHEQSHAYYDFSVNDSAKQNLGLLYGEALPLKFLLPGGRDSVSAAGIPEMQTDLHHPVFSIFDESNYCDKFSWNYGHPYDGWKSDDKKEAASELFASASAVLRFFPESFLSRLQSLYSTDPKNAILTSKIAIAVLNIWEGSGFFEPGLMGNLQSISKGQ